jgi:colicin import membrane protein
MPNPAALRDADLYPPRPGPWGRPVLLAVLVHGALVGALTWGVGWQHESEPVVLEAELWSRTVQAAAPRAASPAPTPAPPPEPTPAPPPPPPPPPPAPAPAPRPAPAPPPPPPGPTQAEIALQNEREQARRAEQARKAEEARKAEQARREAQERQRAEAARKAEAERKAAAAAAAEKREAERRQAELEAARQRNLERMMSQAATTGSGSPQSTGTAAQSSGPSPTYAGRVVSRIRPNIVYPDVIAGNPRAEVEVRAAPDGAIVGRRLTQSSGNPSWDEAVLRAIDRTARLPIDENGRVPSTLILGFRPQD